MNSTLPIDPHTPAGTWPRRARFVAVTALTFAGLHFGVNALLTGRGYNAVPVILGYPDAALAAIGIALVGLLGALVVALITPRERTPLAILALATALMFWAWPAGTMDDWLMHRNPAPGPPRPGPYWFLIADYVFLAALVLAAVLLSWRFEPPSEPGLEPPAGSRNEFIAALRSREGPVGAITAAALAGALLLVLTGPAAAETRRGQVIFAVVAAFYLAVMVASRITNCRAVGWYWLSPFIVGIVGLVSAALRPVATPLYAHINSIPASGLARPLPIEMISLGLIAVTIACGSRSRPAPAAAAAGEGS